MRFYKLLSVVLMLIQSYNLFSQSATITEKIMSIDTYFFDEPNPIPIVKDNPKIYPYFKFEGYEHHSKKKNWKVITLENEYIKLFVLPEIGGKIWGAIEKKTGNEFIYKNEVLKFRNIAMRGPWTSGGIEFNFGIIGHTPATATPVDYIIKNNNDGSVSCIVGTTDLPSRTQWRVEINLQKDKAYFETKASWYNATSLNQSYYNWMTAAAVATEDLEFFIPGNQFLEHNGENRQWSIDKQERELSFYKNNNFSSHKSYHVVGDFSNFFGGYYHNTNVGFGHWALYEEMPGQKLWLWALSRAGGIWENLLTDTDGQYIEFQAGRLFNQYFPGDKTTPITQANFDPYVMDKWSDIWFPYKEIKGMVDASKYGVLNVEQKNDTVYIGINALQTLNENIIVFSNGSEIFNEVIALKPMDVFSTYIPLQDTGKLEVFVGNNKLHYTNDNNTFIKRPFNSGDDLKISKSQQLFKKGWEAMKYREYDSAFQHLSELIVLDPSHQEALVKLAELAYRKTNYKKGIEYINKVLKMDTYNTGANYMAGILYHALLDPINALESFGWAARDIKYRSVSYTQMAEIYISQGNLLRAKEYTQKALDYNRYNINARQIQLIIARKQNDLDYFNKQAKELLAIDPLHHFVTVETDLINSKPSSKGKKIDAIQNEFSAETILELALRYYNLGLSNETLYVLSLKPEDIKIKLWTAYLLKNSNISQSNTLLNNIKELPTDFVFPYRRETIPVLEWVTQNDSHWKFNYFLGLNYIAIGEKEKGKGLLKASGNSSNSATFYALRGEIMTNESYSSRLKDYQKALALKTNDWKKWSEILQFYFKNNKIEEAYITSKKAFKKFPNNYNIALVYAKGLLLTQRYEKCIQVLKTLSVLPSELSNESRNIYFNSHVYLANKYIQEKKYKKAILLLNESKKWPENLGVGKPYDEDYRITNYLLAICYGESNKEKAKDILQKIADYTFKNIEITTRNHIKITTINNVFGLLALKKLGKEKELEKLITHLKESKKENNSNKLILAFFENNRKELLKLKENINISKELWDVIEFLSNH